MIAFYKDFFFFFFFFWYDEQFIISKLDFNAYKWNIV